LPTATIISTDESICLTDSVELISLTGVAPWTITYNNGNGIEIISGIMTSPYWFKPVTSGTYNFTLISVSDINCNNIATGNTTITVNPLPTATLTYSQNITLGNSVNLMTLTGAAPWEVVYNDGTNDIALSEIISSPYVFIPTEAGMYTFDLMSVTDVNGCMNTADGNAVITVNAVAGNEASLMELSTSAGTLTPVFDSEIFEYTIRVAHNIDSITLFAQTTDPHATVNGTGRYALETGVNLFQIMVIAEDGTMRIYTIRVIRESVGIEEIGISEEINVYPNPTQDVLYITSDLRINQIDIHDANGKMIKQIINPAPSISIAELANGVYLLRIQTENGIAIKKITKQ
jgi:hypothetical protein